MSNPKTKYLHFCPLALFYHILKFFVDNWKAETSKVKQSSLLPHINKNNKTFQKLKRKTIFTRLVFLENYLKKVPKNKMWWGQVEKKLIFSIMANLISLVTKTTSAFLEVNTVSIDNWAFKSYYKVTTTLLVFCSIIVTSRQFFGAPIVCDAGSVSRRVFVNLRHDPIKKGPTCNLFC